MIRAYLDEAMIKHIEVVRYSLNFRERKRTMIIGFGFGIVYFGNIIVMNVMFDIQENTALRFRLQKFIINL